MSRVDELKLYRKKPVVPESDLVRAFDEITGLCRLCPLGWCWGEG